MSIKGISEERGIYKKLNLIEGINIQRHSGPFLNWTEIELNDLDQGK